MDTIRDVTLCNQLADDLVSRPSRFWERLAATHAQELEAHGLAEFKRHQALRYFTWQWRWTRLHRSEQARFLLGATPARTLIRCLCSPADLSAASWTGVPWSRRDRWLYTFATRMLWEYARRSGGAAILELDEPELGHPFPIRWQGRLISQDLANSAIEATAIARALDGAEPSHILEIGAGYGRDAYVLLNLFPRCSYTVVDLEPALSISRMYLTTLFPDPQLSFLSPAQLSEAGARPVSLALSISSLQEMTLDQIREYLLFLDGVVVPGGVVYLKQWREWFNPIDGVATRFADYPIPSRWTPLFDEQAPVQTGFQHGAWKL